MRVFVSHAQADLEIVVRLRSELEQRNLSVIGYDDLSPNDNISDRLEEMILASDLTVVIFSELSQQSEWVRKEIGIALKAWSTDKLFLINTGAAKLPLGLRDLQFFQLSDPYGQNQIANAAHQIKLQMLGSAAELVVPVAKTSDHAPQSQPSIHMGYTYLILSILVATTISLMLLAIGLNGVLYILRAIGVESGTVIDDLVRAYWPDEIWFYGIPVLVVQVVTVLAQYFVYRHASNSLASEAITKSSRAEDHVSVSSPTDSTLGASTTDLPPDIFTSYSRKNTVVVDEIVASMRANGLVVWVDRDKPKAKHRYAKVLASAMRRARLVAVVCSQPAFQSDHVAREIYLAGHMKKSFVLIFLEDTSIPDEFWYFLTGFHQIDLSEIPPSNVGPKMRKLLDA